jgi:hypothetical protein
MGPAVKTPSYVDEWPVTARQAEIHRLMLSHQRERMGQALSIRSLQILLGISGTNGVVCHLKPLVAKGLVTKVEDEHGGRPRYVAVDPGCCPACGGPIEGGGEA